MSRPRSTPVLLLIAATGFAVVTAFAVPPTIPASRPITTTRPAVPFAIVFVDAKTERVLGPFPYDRSVYASAINRAAASGARGVVLKFFIDLPKTEAGDHALVESLGKTRVILQAHIDDAEQSPNPLPKRFTIQPERPPDGAKVFSGDSGVIPLPQLSKEACDVGFIDYTTIDHMPMIERYKGSYVKSLYTCCLELALGERARIVPGKALEIGGRKLPLDADGQVAVRYPAVDDLQYISMIDLLDGPPRAELRDKVVILGFDGAGFEPVQTPAGPIRPHRAFCYALLSLYEQLR
jgi:hypothetical protein